MDYINRIRLKVQKIKYIDSELERPDLLLIEEIGYKETRKDLRNEIHELVKKAIKENN
jgi:phosphate uptake regulator